MTENFRAWLPRIQGLLIAAATFWIYWPALHGDWLWEDDLYITANPLLTDPNRLWKVWFAPGSFIEYYPIEETVQWLQWQLWHLDTLGYHITNVVLHLISALLVWRLLSKFGLKLAWLGGLIFAIHPVMVESVAWITEFKNTLSLPPFLLAVCFYLDFEERGHQRDYLLALGWFLAAMLCKPTMVMFPFIILLYAWWKRSRINWNDFIASVPFFITSLILGLMTLWSGIWFGELHHLQKITVALGGSLSRVALTGLSLSFYFSKVIVPVKLAPIYPYWKIDPPSFLQFLPWPALVAVLYLLWAKQKSWGRHALLGFGFFLIMLLPFVTINVGGYTNFTWVMDHFLYIPIIGLIGLTAAGLEQIKRQLSPTLRGAGMIFLTAVLFIMAWGSHAYAGMFLNEKTLWTYTLERNDNAWLAHYNLGEVYTGNGQTAEAMEQYEKALSLNPNLSQAHNNLGLMLLDAGHVPEAREHLQTALQIYPDYPEAHDNMGLLLFRTGHPQDAIEEYQEALRFNPSFDQAYNNLGNALAMTGRVQEAMEQYQHAVALNPANAMSHNNMGLILMHAGYNAEAIEQFGQALKINPQMDDTHNNLGIALFQAGHTPEALEQFETALQINPRYAEAHNNLGIILARLGRNSEATKHFAAALAIDPQYPDAEKNLKQLQSSAKTVPTKP